MSPDAIEALLAAVDSEMMIRDLSMLTGWTRRATART